LTSDPGGAHEAAWAEALAQEHAHQRELLAALRDELGAFARECSSALTALDALIGLAGVGEILTAARTASQHASIAAEVGRRLPALGRPAPSDDRDAQLYARLGGDEDVPPPLVRHAGQLLRAGPRRTDRELLNAVVSAAGARARIEQMIGPAPFAALAALQPLARWAPALAGRRPEGGGRELLASASKDLTQVLQAAAGVGPGAGEVVAADTAALADALRETADHVEAAVKAVKEGKLEQVLAEARLKLQEDLDRLRGVHEGAHEAPAEWREARQAEHAALTEEVREKLEKVERLRRVLGALLPHLQAIVRALTAIERLQALEQRLDPGSAGGGGRTAHAVARAR